MEYYESAFRLRGVNLAGMPPIRDVYLPLEPGLTVLYGKNGAGKSRVMTGLQEAFSANRVDDGVRRLYFEAPLIEMNFTGYRLRDIFPGHPWLWVGSLAGMARHPRDWTDRETDQIVEELVEDGPRRSLVLRLILEQADKTSYSVNNEDVEALCEVALSCGFAVNTSRHGRTVAVTCTVTEDTPVLRQLYDDVLLRYRQRLENDSSFRSHVVSLAYSTATDWPSFHEFREGSLIQEDMRSAALVAVGAEPPPSWAGDHYLSLGGRSWPVWGPPVLNEDDTDLENEALTAIAMARTIRQPSDPHLRRYRDLPLWYRTGDEGPQGRSFQPGQVFAEDGLELAGDVVELLAELSTHANEYFRRLLDAPPELKCAFRARDQWATQGLVAWHAIDRSGMRLPLSNLSRAHQRWAKFAARLALLRLRDSRPAVVILDEPEQALHRQAERRLAIALTELADELQVPVIVATHSPVFLNDRAAKLFHVQRSSDGTTTLASVPGGLREEMESLGLDAADLLQFCRVVLLVEGQHELLILDELFRGEFKAAGIELFSTRGAKNLGSAADASFLWRYTEAHVMVLVDNEDDEAVATIWTRAQRAGSEEDQLRALSELKVGGKAEGKFLQEFCSAVLSHGQANRVSIHGLSLPDILEYLPVGSFAPKAKSRSWASLRDDYVASASGKNFKEWMRTSHAADYSDANVLDAVRALDAIPEDLSRVARLAVAASGTGT